MSDGATRVYEPPSDEQLARFIALRRFGPGYGPDKLEAVERVMAHPTNKAALLKEHRDFQDALWLFDDEVSR